MKILAINPGSTSTKIAVYHDEHPLLIKTITHSPEEVRPFKKVTDQRSMRLQLIKDVLREEGIPVEFDAVIGRGSLAKPLEGGVYKVTDQMVSDAIDAYHQHACDLGCVLAQEIASERPGTMALIADPATVDEMLPEAHITGSPKIPRVAIWHALNQRAIARRYAKQLGKRYEDLNLIVCHLGGGISVAAHGKGRCLDVNNCLNGDGPFSPERAGTLPACGLIDLSYSGNYTKEQLQRRVAGHAGIEAHLGTTDMREIIARIESGDDHARLIVDAMCFQVAKSIAAESAVLCGQVDAILLTGGMAYSEYIVKRIVDRISFLAPVEIFPGEDEMESLAMNALAALKGEVSLKEY